jgi:rhodanese-related sulfurtransferase
VVGDRPAKNDLFDALASAGKALGNGRRAELVDVLAQGERSVEELAAEIGQSVANTSQHLQVLLRAGLVRTQRQGTRIYYSLATPEVGTLWAALCQVAADHVGELDALARAYLGDRSELATISRDELVDRLAAGDVIVLDVRPTAEYHAGHIPGALSVPITTLDQRWQQLPADTQVVAYCRGPYCVYADDAVRLLRQRGYQAARLDDGFPEWTHARLPVETGAA